MTLPIIITTYDSGDGVRTQVAIRTIQSLLNNLQNTDRVFILADDGSPAPHIDRMSDLLVAERVIHTDAKRGGVGVSKNLALKEAYEISDIVLLMEDDWELTQPLNMDRYIKFMQDNADVGMIRLGYLGGTTLQATYRGGDPFNTYWELARGSDVYVYSGQISLRHQRFYNAIGYHKEGISPGEEELEYCIRYNKTENAPVILWPAEFGTTLNAGAFKNIGMDSSLNWITPE